ncbi:MAG: AAA family ATPase [Candidatus Peribacteraceae bacterium]|nr:AAA family ATPase [Candidatus Peribacteraceae bacterium]
MHITSTKVDNFRSLKEVAPTLSSLVTIVGENNAGKSSFLIGLNLFFKPEKLKKEDFYDREKDIAITLQFEGLDSNELSKLDESHREKIAKLVVNDKLKLVRRYKVDGSNSLNYIGLRPSDLRFDQEKIDEVMSGKSGAQLKTAVLASYPEVSANANGVTTQKGFRELIENYINSLPSGQLVEKEMGLTTGIPESIYAVFPEIIYVPAVKDISDELKTKEATSFGKILKFLLETVSKSPKISAIAESFTELNKHLNCIVNERGEKVDERLEEIMEIEKALAENLAAQFQQMKLEIKIPPPELKTIFGNAKLFLNDGVDGEVESKGDGVKRAVMFALLRTHVELRNKREDQAEAAPSQRYLFLFEEPELYLHPRGQRILYDALVSISKQHQVIMSTHSPYFLCPDGIGTFLRINKDEVAAPQVPYSTIREIDLLNDLSKREAFQTICYENNNAGFFCNRVVLVEGDSDLIYLKHISKTLSKDWDFDFKNIALVKIGGKGNFKRYRTFFECFGVEVRIIADLDCVVDKFTELGDMSAHQSKQSDLIQEARRLVASSQETSITADEARRISSSRTFLERYNEVKAITGRMVAGTPPTAQEVDTIESLFSDEEYFLIRNALRSRSELMPKKIALANAIRAAGVNILIKGSIEEYYPSRVGGYGADKVTNALAACDEIKTKEQALACCPVIADGTTTKPELEAIFTNIFS